MHFHTESMPSQIKAYLKYVTAKIVYICKEKVITVILTNKIVKLYIKNCLESED